MNGLYTLTGSSCGGPATCVHTITITITASDGTVGIFTVTI